LHWPTHIRMSMSLANASVILKSGRDKSVRARHPRLFSGAIKEIESPAGKVRDGDVVDVCDNKGAWLARGVINQLSAISVRLLTWDENQAIDEAMWRTRIHAAAARRAADPLLSGTDARRIVFGESDGLPGLIADQYAGQVVAEFSALCSVRQRDVILAALHELPGVSAVHERLDEERLRAEFGNNARLIEALRRAAPVPDAVMIREGELVYKVNLAGGQKTGFYLDQRANRARVAAYCANRSVLNTFAYSGAFGVAAARAGAHSVLNVDSSADALALCAENAALNGVAERMSSHSADVFSDLRARRTAGERYGVVILDPPKMAHNPGQIDKAARAYKDLNRLGFALLESGGVLATFSCSGVVSAALLQQIVFQAALEAGRSAAIVERLTQASDHPVALTYPEGEYLKGFVVRVD
jgi:23S rRNA (cytosine1962-C5)-methyltransferase